MKNVHIEKDPYKPISCDLYDQIEIAAMRGKPVNIQFYNQGTLQNVVGKIGDTQTRAGEEYILLENGQEIRMDRITVLDGIPFNKDNSC